MIVYKQQREEYSSFLGDGLLAMKWLWTLFVILILLAKKTATSEGYYSNRRQSTGNWGAIV